MKKFAIIVAGGSGQRMGSETPKQFLLLRGKPLIHHTIQTFITAFADVQIILVLPAVHLKKGAQIIQEMGVEKSVQIVAGGETRFQSVKNGLQFVSDPSVVFVHDGVRCLVSEKLIKNCYNQALEKGSAVPVVSATDSIRIDEGEQHFSIDRSTVKIVQTPQTFLSALLLEAFKQEYKEAFTDEATVVEASGKKVFLIEGEYNNLKITRPIDLCIAEKLMDETVKNK